MSDNDVSVSFGADIDGLAAGVDQAKKQIESMGTSVAVAAEQGGKSMQSLGFATAGTTREFIVLGHEVISGNFSRIPGSLLVMAERMGNLHGIVEGVISAINPLSVAAAGAVIAFGAWAESAYHTAQAISEVDISMAAHGRTSILTSQQIEKYVEQLDRVYNVSKDDAAGGIAALTAAVTINHQRFDELVKILPGVAVGMGKSIPEAAQILAESMDHPAEALKKLQEKFSLLKNSELEAFLEAEKSGDIMKEQDILAEALANRFGGLEAKIVSVGKGFHDMWSNGADALDRYSTAVSNFITKKSDFALQGDARREKENAAAEAALVAEEDKLAKQKEQEKTVSDTIILQKTLTDQVDKEKKQHEEIARLKTGKDAANSIGDTKAAESFQQSINSIQEKITRDEKRANEERVRDFNAAETAKLQGQRSAAEESYSITRERAQLEKDIGHITEQQEIDILKQAEQQRYNVEMDSLVAQEALWKKGSADYEKVENEITKATNKHELERLKIEQQAQQQRKALIGQYVSVFGDGLSSMLKGTTSFKNAAINAFSGLADIWMKKIEEKVVAWVLAETEQTTATTAANTERQAAETAAMATAKAERVANNTAVLTGDSAVVFGGVFANLAPLIGPAAAGPAAAAQAQVLAQIPAASFDVGTWNVPHDMVANLHAGERVMTAEENRSFSANKGGSGGGVEIHFNGPVYGQKDFESAVANAVKTSARNFNPALAKAIKP